MPAWWTRYWQRHQHPACRVLHVIGVPLLAAAAVLAGVQLAAWRWDLWWRPVGLLVLSYLLQWVGHRIEGNDMGEVVLIKKWLGRPYIAVSPRYGGGVERPHAGPDPRLHRSPAGKRADGLQG